MNVQTAKERKKEKKKERERATRNIHKYPVNPAVCMKLGIVHYYYRGAYLVKTAIINLPPENLCFTNFPVLLQRHEQGFATPFFLTLALSNVCASNQYEMKNGPSLYGARLYKNVNHRVHCSTKIKFLFVFLSDPNSRTAPTEPPTHHNDGRGYSITPARLAELRSHFLYWFFDKGGSNDIGDLQKDIHASNPQLHKNFNFQLPFYGFRFNYTRVRWPFYSVVSVLVWLLFF